MDKVFAPIENSRLALTKKKGHSIWFDFLILFCLYTVEQIVVAILMVPAEMYVLLNHPIDTSSIDLSSPEGMSFSIDLSSPERMSTYIDKVMEITSHPAIALITLFSTLAMIIAVYVYAVKIEKWPVRALGIKKEKWYVQYGLGLVIGFVIFSLAVLFCKVTGAVEISLCDDKLKYLIPVFAIGWIIQGCSEEIMCRAWLMVSIGRKHKAWVGVLVNSLVFAFLHMLNPGLTLLAFFNLFLFGLFASIVFLIDENLWIVAAIHSVWNFVQGNFFGISVSGNGVVTSIFKTTLAKRKFVINGGAFGLEGGLGVTIVLLIGIAVAYVIYRKKHFGKEIANEPVLTENN